MESKISVIIPVYKTEKYINKCVDSVLAQEYETFELLMTDDGSPDGAPQICDEYALMDKRVIVIHQKNKGVSAARNAALKCGSGQWLVFVDSDDYVTEKYLSDLMAESSDLVINDVIYIREDGLGEGVHTHKEFFPCMVDRQTIENMLLNDWLNNIVSKRYDYNVVRNKHILFNAMIDYAEDIFFSIAYLLYVKSVSCTKKNNYFYVRYLKKEQLSENFSINIAIKANQEICRLLYPNDESNYTRVLNYRFLHDYKHYIDCNVKPLYPWNSNINVAFIKSLMNDSNFLKLIERNGNFTFFSDSLINAICRKNEKQIWLEYTKWAAYRLFKKLSTLFVC